MDDLVYVEQKKDPENDKNPVRSFDMYGICLYMRMESLDLG